MRSAIAQAHDGLSNEHCVRSTMGRLPRAPKRIAGVPLTKKTGKDLTAAAIDIVMGRVVPSEVAKERIETCNGCEAFDGRRCAVCGCFMHKKVSLPTSHCPLGKWQR